MDADEDRRLFRNAQKRLAYASMDAEKKAKLLVKNREYCRCRSQSDGPPSGMLGRLVFDTNGSGRFRTITRLLLC